MNQPFVLSTSSRTRPSPYYDATVAAGVQGFSVYNHMLLPTFYVSAEEDYWPIINGVSMWDVAVERQVELRGPDAAVLATMLTPRDLSKMKIGQCKYIPMVDHNGGLINDPVLLKLAEDHFWISIADSDVRLWALGIAGALGLDVTVTEPDVSPLAIQGPKANDVAASLFGEWVRELKFFWFREFDFDGIPLVIARSGWSKQGGFELYLRDGSMGTELWDRVAAAGAPWDIKPGTPSTLERIEGGLLSYGNDMTLENTPFEVGLGKYCAIDQEADFIGKAALQRVRDEGVTRNQVGIFIEGDKIASNTRRWPVWSMDDEIIGEVTSAAHSPRLERNISFAILDMAHQEPGTPVRIDMSDCLAGDGSRDIREGSVAPLPFIS